MKAFLYGVLVIAVTMPTMSTACEIRDGSLSQTIDLNPQNGSSTVSEFFFVTGDTRIHLEVFFNSFAHFRVFIAGVERENFYHEWPIQRFPSDPGWKLFTEGDRFVWIDCGDYQRTSWASGDLREELFYSPDLRRYQEATLDSTQVMFVTHADDMFDGGRITMPAIQGFAGQFDISKMTTMNLGIRTGPVLPVGGHFLRRQDMDYFIESDVGDHRFSFPYTENFLMAGGFLDWCLCESTRDAIGGLSNPPVILPRHRFVYITDAVYLHPNGPQLTTNKELASMFFSRITDAQILSWINFYIWGEDPKPGEASLRYHFCPSPGGDDPRLVPNSQYKLNVYYAAASDTSVRLLGTLGSGSHELDFYFVPSARVGDYVIDNQRSGELVVTNPDRTMRTIRPRRDR